MKEPLISIIVPFYNTHPALLERCVNSIFNQSYKQFELLLIDDGSVHEIAEYADILALRDERVRITHLNHAGVSAARNFGLETFSGDYLVFMDADDEITPRFLEEAVTVAAESKADIVYGRVVYRFKSRDTEYPFEHIALNQVYVIQDYRSLLNLQKKFLSKWDVRDPNIPKHLQMGPVAKLYTRNIADKVRFDTALELGEDTLFNFYAAVMASTVAFCNSVWYIYYQNAGSSSWGSNYIDGLRRSGVGLRHDFGCEYDNAWCGRDCYSIISLADFRIKSSGRGAFAETVKLLNNDEVRSYFAKFRDGEFDLLKWQQLICHLARNGHGYLATSALIVKRLLSLMRGKTLREKVKTKGPKRSV